MLYSCTHMAAVGVEGLNLSLRLQNGTNTGLVRFDTQDISVVCGTSAIDIDS